MKTKLSFLVSMLCISVYLWADVYRNYEYVDLGLPSGLLWATRNIGAASPEDVGNLYAWGETETKEEYTRENYKFASSENLWIYTKYNNTDHLTRLEPIDDAAVVNMGGGWRMPTRDDVQELLDECELEGGENFITIKNQQKDQYILLPGNSNIGNKYKDVFYYTSDWYGLFIFNLSSTFAWFNDIGENNWRGLPIRAVIQGYMVTTSVNNASMGTVSSGGRHPIGAEITLSAQANAGYEFVRWSDGNTDNPRTLEVVGEQTYTAIFETIRVKFISLNMTEANLHVGESVTLEATLLPEDAVNKNYTWSTSDSSIAQVQNGVVTARSNGEAIITATAEDGGLAAHCIIRVTTPVTGITLNKATLALHPNQSETLIATILPATASNQNYAWKSDNLSVAIVENGVVKALANGTATISVISEEGEFTASCNVTVTTPVADVKLSIMLHPQNTILLAAMIAPTTASNKDCIWASDNEDVATVEDGLITAIADGTATISVITDDGNHTDKIMVTVTTPIVSVESVSLNTSSLIMTPNSAQLLLATVLPANATNTNYTWSSENPNIAMVLNDGWVIAKEIGTTKIIVTTEDGGYTATCDITVQTSIPTNVAFQQMQNNVSVEKVFEDGVVYILKPTGEKYLMDGRKVE